MFTTFSHFLFFNFFQKNYHQSTTKKAHYRMKISQEGLNTEGGILFEKLGNARHFAKGCKSRILVSLKVFSMKRNYYL